MCEPRMQGERNWRHAWAKQSTDDVKDGGGRVGVTDMFRQARAEARTCYRQARDALNASHTLITTLAAIQGEKASSNSPVPPATLLRIRNASKLSAAST